MQLPFSPFWPPGLPHTMQVPDRNLFEHLAASAARVPDKTVIDFYGHRLRYADLHESALRLAGYLQQHFGVRKGDRVLLQMQNCPQYMMAYFAVLRADAVVVALNPMCTPEEVAYYAGDCGARVLITMQDHLDCARPLLQSGAIDGCVVGSYADFAGRAADVPWLSVPAFVMAPHAVPTQQGVHDFMDCLAAGIAPTPIHAQGPDLAVLGYTSGTTGKPKGAMLSHRALAHNIVLRAMWHDDGSEQVQLLVLPLSHLAATQIMNMSVLAGDTMVLLARWDAANAIALIVHHRVSAVGMVTPMLIDFMAHPAQPDADLSSVRRLFCSATATPGTVSDAVEKRLNLKYIESYGMTETCGGTHVNPPNAPRRSCGGIACINTDSRVLDLETGAELGPGQSGEIVTHTTSLFDGYWNRPDATHEAFIEIEGKQFIRTGDIGHYDADGYFYITDRIKRMINASGLKVWPAEVEAWLFEHPAVQEVSVISARDGKRGETVKAFVVLRPQFRGQVMPQEITEWARSRMAVYKVPRLVEFIDALPRTASGKLLWRQLQEEQDKRDRQAA